MVGGYDEPALIEFQRQVTRHEELAKKFQAEFPLYQQKQKDYDAAVAEFEHICASRRDFIINCRACAVEFLRAAHACLQRERRHCWLARSGRRARH